MTQLTDLAPLRLRCMEVRRHLKGGITQPLLIAAQNESGKTFEMVLKVRQPNCKNGHFGATSLACELVCAVIARAIGLPVPDYAIVEIPRSLPQYIPHESVRRLFQNNLGSNFGCQYHPGLMTWKEEDNTRASNALLKNLEDVLSFDVTVVNTDRNKSNSNLLLRGDDSFFLIDHSLNRNL